MPQPYRGGSRAGDGDVSTRVAEMCEKLLANPLIESYEVEPLRER